MAVVLGPNRPGKAEVRLDAEIVGASGRGRTGPARAARPHDLIKAGLIKAGRR